MAGNKNAVLYDGILCINKPEGFTSFDVVAKIRGILGQRRVGHAGTLDPMATGVLPVFLGRATRICDVAPQREKSYRAGLKLGLTTDTQDSTGVVLAETQSNVTRQQLEQTLNSLVGESMQLPPMYSAIKIGGQKLYHLARQGIEVERPRRPITIYDIQLLEFDQAAQTALIDVTCSEGTYVRTICHDAGQLLGVGAVMTSLCRTRALGFGLEECVTLQQLQAAADRGDQAKLILPTEQALLDYPLLVLDEVQTRLFSNGARLDLDRMPRCPKAQVLRVRGQDGCFLGLARRDEEKRELVILKLLA